MSHKKDLFVLFTTEFIKKNIDKCIDLKDKISDILDTLKSEKFSKQIDKERNEYGKITFNKFEELVYTVDYWIPVNDEDIDYNSSPRSKCEMDDCWYSGNMDRLGEAKYYRLKGTTLQICDVCFGNNRIDHQPKLIEEAYWNDIEND